MANPKSEPGKKQPGWLNKTQMAKSCGVTTQGFDSWGVLPVAKIGRENFYTASDVVDNRVQKALEKYNKSNNSPPVEGDVSFITDPKERIQAEKLQEEIKQLRLKNAVLEGRSLPAWAVTEVLTRILSVAIGVFDTLPLDIKRRHPDLDVRVIRMFEERIAKIRNEAATVGEQLQDILDDVIAEAEDRIR